MQPDKKVKIVQTSQHKWKLVTPQGTVLTEDLTLNSVFDAERYVKAYISSFSGWSYAIVPLSRRNI